MQEETALLKVTKSRNLFSRIGDRFSSSPESVGDRAYAVITTAFAVAIPLLLLLIAGKIMQGAWPAFREAGFGFFTSNDWDVNNGRFGAAAAIYGTVVSSALALLIATPLALGSALFISEFSPKWIRQPLSFLVELLAAIPSVVYGLWGIFVLLPLLRNQVMPFVQEDLKLGNLPIFAGATYGPSMLAAGIILSIMILPYISSVTREVLKAVPRDQREAGLALGYTRWEVISKIVLPYARSGIAGGVMLGLGRALGETMAVTMLIGNSPRISMSLFAPGYTLASRIANEFNEAAGQAHVSALMATGATLFLISIIINGVARSMVGKVKRIG